MATRKNTKSSAKRGISVDFSDTQSRALIPEGEYLVEVEDVEQKTSENSGNDYLSLTLVVADGKFKGSKMWHNCSLQPQALFNLRAVLEALGFDIPQGSMDLDPSDMIGQTCGVSVVHEVYEGAKKPRPAEFFNPEDRSPEGGEGDDDANDESGDDLTAEDVQKMDLKELLALATENEIKVTAKQKKDVDAVRSLLIEELELESGEDEGGEEDGDITHADVQEMDKDELLELASENEVKLTLKQKKSVELMRQAICEALELEPEDGADEDGDSDLPTHADIQEADKEDLLELAEEHGVKFTLKEKKNLQAMKDKLCSTLGLTGEDEDGDDEIKVGDKVTFEDDEEQEQEGKVKAIQDGVATVLVGKEEWEIELEDLTKA